MQVYVNLEAGTEHRKRKRKRNFSYNGTRSICAYSSGCYVIRSGNVNSASSLSSQRKMHLDYQPEEQISIEIYE